MKFIYSFIVAFCLMPLSTFGQSCSTLVIDTLATINTCTQWNQNGLPFELTSSSPNNCSLLPYMGAYYIFTAQLDVDLSSLNDVNTVTIQVADAAGGNNFYLYAGNTLVDSVNHPYNGNTIVLNNMSNLNVDKLVLLSTDIYLGIVSITIEYNCATICSPKVQVESEQGDVYIDDPCYGAILTSPSGNCFRVRVNDSGSLITEAVTCP